MQLQQPREAAAHAIADKGEEVGTDEAKGERGASLGNQDERQTTGHHRHHPTRGRWSLQPLRSP